MTSVAPVTLARCSACFSSGRSGRPTSVLDFAMKIVGAVAGDDPDDQSSIWMAAVVEQARVIVEGRP